MPKPLTASTRQVLDNRFVLYDPEQQLAGPEDLVNLVCPIHGAYQVALKKLHRMYTYRTLKAPGCPGCRFSRLPDPEYLREVKYRFRGLTRGGVMAELYPPAPGWAVMEHWIEPRLLAKCNKRLQRSGLIQLERRLVHGLSVPTC